MRCALLLSLLAACAAPNIVSTAPAARSSHALAPGLGRWTWEQSHVHPGHIRIEREEWLLQPESKGAISGWVFRENRFLSTDGQPFACIQGLSYSRRARYKVRGTQTALGLVLEETQVQTWPSPCEDGLRPLQSYTGKVQAPGRLTLVWPGGEQVLQASLPADGPRQADKSTLNTPLRGAWSWTARQSEGSIERTEVEHWQFEERPDHKLFARYRREVLVVDKSGARIACAGSDRYSYQDNYELQGSRDKNRGHLQELSINAPTHACVDGERVFDAAELRVYPDSMVLEWRGRRLQVLKPTKHP